MTFEQYLKQETPTLQPYWSVLIPDENFIRLNDHNIVVKFPNRNVKYYVHKRGWLFTCDIDGNKVAPTCFKIEVNND